MPTEGQTATGPNGEKAVFRGGQWVIQPSAAPRAVSIPLSPQRQAAENRADDSNRRAEDANRRAEEAEARAREAEARARDKDAREGRTLDARGGVDTTESERNAAFLATRVANGLRDLQRIGPAGAPSLKDALIGGTLLGNYTTDETRQRTINAQRDILDAALTLGTGAAYTQEQIDAYRGSYFPQPGDKPATVADKANRLQVLMNSARVKAGAAAGQIDEALGSMLTSEADAALKAGATKDQINSIASVYGRPAFGEDLDAAIAARDAGRPVAVQNYQGGGEYDDSYASQIGSGLYEGLANTLGLPVDAVNAALGLGAQGVNAFANTDLQMSDRPFLGSEYLKDVFRDIGGIRRETQESGPNFSRRVGQSVGGAVVPAAATARTGGQVASLLASGLGGGLGAATAREVAPGNPYAELAGEVIGGGLGGGASLARARQLSMRESEAAVPTIPDLKQQASDLYARAEANGVTASPQQTQDLQGRVASILAGEGQISPTGRLSEVHPKVREGYQLIQDYAGQPMSPTQMQTVRGVLSDARMSQDPSESRIARMLVNEFDDFSAPLAPELSEARSVASRYLQAQELERARELAGARAGQFSGSGFENALRTDYRALDRKIIKDQAQFAPEVEEAIRTVSRGTTGSNIARNLGRFAPTGTVSAGLSGGVPFMIGNAIGGPLAGGAAAAATMGTGTAARSLATGMGLRNAEVAELLARNGGAIDYAPVLSPELERLVALAAAGQLAQTGDGRPNVEQQY